MSEAGTAQISQFIDRGAISCPTPASWQGRWCHHGLLAARRIEWPLKVLKDQYIAITKLSQLSKMSKSLQFFKLSKESKVSKVSTVSKVFDVSEMFKLSK